MVFPLDRRRHLNTYRAEVVTLTRIPCGLERHRTRPPDCFLTRFQTAR